MSMNLVTLLYLVASICFIQALKGLSHPTTSILRPVSATCLPVSSSAVDSAP
jgi:NAD/NADP transhydrogenase beta subunit